MAVAVPFASADEPARLVDLADFPEIHHHLQRVFGATGTGEFGVPVAAGEDVDGDGRPDVAVAHFTASPGGAPFAGEVDLVFGQPARAGNLDTAIDGPGFLRILGTAPFETTGSEIWMGDVTGDGVGDLLVCRQNFTPDPSRPGAGALSILVGGPQLRDLASRPGGLDLAAPPAGVTVTTLVGAAASDRLCIWTRTGDVDGDGITDLVVGADQEDPAGERNAGGAWVVRGGPHLASGATVDLADFGNTAWEGLLAHVTPPAGSTGFHLGATCQVGDLDGNGRGEVILAAALARGGAAIPPAGTDEPAEFIGGAPGGRVFIVWDDAFPDGTWPAGFTLDAAAPQAQRTVLDGLPVPQSLVFGEELLAGEDYDADGTPDLFVGDLFGGFVGSGHVFFNAAGLKGEVTSLTSLTAGVGTTLIQGFEIASLAGDTAAHADFDGDGIADLAFGTPDANPEGRQLAGTIHTFFGRPGGWPAVIQIAPGQLPSTEQVRVSEILGRRGTVDGDRGDTLCYSAAAADLDGDGRAELVVNEMLGNGASPGTIDVGNLLVLNGILLTPPGPPEVPPGQGR